MTHDYLQEIESLKKKIDLAIETSNFESLATLSMELERVVFSLVEDKQYKATITRKELDALQRLLLHVEEYQKETSVKFKHYTLKVSQKRKMHQAYKQ